MLEDKARKAQLIADLSGAQKEHTVVTLIKLLDFFVEELRKDNDTAVDIALYRNQGAIQGYDHLKDCIQRGLPEGPVKESS